MKIDKIRFQNIHSLKGYHEIDFSNPPLCNSGLFAITGPTGAGKSTILDVITLALFNQIPRFDKKITTTEIEKIGSVVTHFEDKAFAEIDYQSNDKKYRSTWEIEKNSKKNWKDYEMKIAELPSGQILDVKKGGVPAENERIIGLNYNQFIRSILLSQGEFAKFLKSDEKERAELLESITGTEIYREIGKAAFQKAKTKKEEIDLKKKSIAAIEVWSEAEIEAKNNLLKEFKLLIASLKQNISVDLEKINNIKKYKELKVKSENLKEEKGKLEQRKAVFQPYQLKLEKHEQLDNYRGIISVIIADKASLVALESRLQSNVKSITELHSELSDALREMTTFTHEEVDSDNFMMVMKHFEMKIIDFDKQLSHLKNLGIEQKENFIKLIKQDNFEFNSVLRDLGNKTEERWAFVLQKLSSLNLDPTIQETDIEIQQIIKEIQVKNEKLAFNAQLIKTLSSLKIDIENIELKLQENLKSNKVGNEIHHKLLENKKIIEGKIQVLRAEKEKQYKIATFEDHRKTLMPEEACPLCGATEHPYLTHQELIEFGNVSFDLITKELELKSIEKEISETSNLISKNEGIIESLQKNIAYNNIQIQEIESKIDHEYKAVALETIEKDLEKTQSAHKKWTQELKNRGERRQLENIKEVLEKLKTIQTNYISIDKERKKLYSGTDINGDADKIQNKFTNALGSIKVLESKNIEIAESKEKLSNELNIKVKELEAALNGLGYSSIEEAKSHILEDVSLTKIKNEKASISQIEIEINNSNLIVEKGLAEMQFIESEVQNLSNIENLIKENENKRDQTSHQIGAIELEIEQNKERQKAIKDAQLQLELLEKAAKNWLILDAYIGDATGNKFAKFAQNLNLSYLISFANNRLKSLTDRYLLTNNDQDGDFRIIDLYQGSTIRSVKTLSGGESFLVSLALALSLSDLASRNVKLESLFIDEGFGTLDAETLELSIVTLEKLQAESNRTIGIISHIDSLKERINTQIQIEKNNIGYSVINIVG